MQIFRDGVLHHDGRFVPHSEEEQERRDAEAYEVAFKAGKQWLREEIEVFISTTNPQPTLIQIMEFVAERMED